MPFTVLLITLRILFGEHNVDPRIVKNGHKTVEKMAVVLRSFSNSLGSHYPPLRSLQQLITSFGHKL